MHRSLCAIVGLITQAVCVAADPGDTNCLDVKLGCPVIEQVQQQSIVGHDSGSITGVVKTKDPSIDLTLSTKDIDELYQSNDSKQRKNQIKASPAGSQDEVFSSRDFELGQKIARAARVDCRQKYVNPDPNLLLIIPLLVETVTGTGCKW